jgi:glycosyltransferase involved in cell wall biosynthesis
MPGVAALAGLRILLVGPVPPPAGGMANQTRQLGELLRGQGAVVEALATNAPYRPAWAGRMPGLRALFRLVPYIAALWRGTGRNQLVHLMANSGWSWHLFALPAIGVARLRGTPLVVNYRGGEAEAFLQRSGGIVGWALRRCSRLVVPSGFLHAVFARHGQAAEVVPNIIDTQRFRPAAPGAPREAERIVVARNLEPIYDNATAIRAFARVLLERPQARLVIAGSGPDEAALKALAAELGVVSAVQFAGRVERDEMAALLRSCAIALNPSRVDNMPNSVLEALASGVPVVSTAVGGVPYIVQDGQTALLVPPQEPAAMAAALLRLLGDAALAQQLAHNGLRDVQRYTWERVAPLWAAVYEQALARGGPGAQGAVA